MIRAPAFAKEGTTLAGALDGGSGLGGWRDLVIWPAQEGCEREGGRRVRRRRRERRSGKATAVVCMNGWGGAGDD